VRGARGKRLLRQRGEKIERGFSRLCDTDGMRRTHLRRHPNILKRLLIHAGGTTSGCRCANSPAWASRAVAKMASRPIPASFLPSCSPRWQFYGRK